AAFAPQLLWQGRDARALPRDQDPADEPQAGLRRRGRGIREHAGGQPRGRPHRHGRDDRMSDRAIDRSTLPIRRPAFNGTVKRTLDGSEPDWGFVAPIPAPDGAPNILLV